MIDWGDGDYARTAVALVPVAEVALDAAGVRAGDRVLDVACGTGNVAAAAVGRGASVVGVDAAQDLLSLARERTPEAEFLSGDAGALPVADAGFDAALSVFGVIFAADPAVAAAELLRVVRPGGGRVVLTSWVPEGPIAAAGRLLSGLLGAAAGDPPRWGDRAWVQALLEGAGATGVSAEERGLAFTAASPEAWFADQVDHHPVWRHVRRQVPGDRWADLHEQSVAVLAAGNEDPAAFRTTSRYLVVRATRPAPAR